MRRLFFSSSNERDIHDRVHKHGPSFEQIAENERGAGYGTTGSVPVPKGQSEQVVYGKGDLRRVGECQGSDMPLPAGIEETEGGPFHPAASGMERIPIQVQGMNSTIMPGGLQCNNLNI